MNNFTVGTLLANWPNVTLHELVHDGHGIVQLGVEAP